MKVRFKKLNEKAVVPEKAHESDAGFDLTATSFEQDWEGNYVYGTGIAVEIPEGHVGLLFPRSSISKHGVFLTNSVGVIDSHYRGEVMMKFRPTAYGVTNHYHIGERIGQLIIMPYPTVELEEAKELSETDRGEGGYGSSGK